MSQPHSSSAWSPGLVVVALLASLVTTGCATVGDFSTGFLPGSSAPAGDTAAAPRGSCTIVLQPSRGEPKIVEMPLHEGATVQTALDFSKATRKFGRMEIHVLRTPPAHGPGPARVQKMNVEFNRKRRWVNAEYDYALYPNDRIVVKEDATTIIDDTVEAVAGKLGIPMITQWIK